MATINVQADSRRAHPDTSSRTRPPRPCARSKTASKEGLRELRAVLDVLRRVDAGDGDGLAPAPGLDQLEGLVERARQAGLPVTLTVTGGDRPLPTEVDLAAYRIVQESLTNTIRHAGPGDGGRRAWTSGADAVHLEVTDTGAGPSDRGSAGFGLVGMRERAASVGGTVEAGRGTAAVSG